VLDGAPSVANWLSAAPRLRIVVTSRAALHVSGEREHAVPPLGLPAPDDHHAVRTEAVELFIDRARTVAPEFAVDDGSLPEIARICRRLDGLPLALEIAAARIKLLPVAAIRRRLDDSLALLTHSARDVPERHRSLHAAVSWSYGLLSEPQQAAFRGLAIFRGGWDIEAAEAVALASTTLRADPLAVMAALLDENLIRRQPDTAGEPRYEMLETLREFGRERLIEAGDVDVTGERHARWFLELAERAEPALTGSQQAGWLDRLERDADNLRAALHWAVDRRDGDLSMRLTAACGGFGRFAATSARDDSCFPSCFPSASRRLLGSGPAHSPQLGAWHIGNTIRTPRSVFTRPQSRCVVSWASPASWLAGFTISAMP
jgi:predicted ATPase